MGRFEAIMSPTRNKQLDGEEKAIQLSACAVNHATEPLLVERAISAEGSARRPLRHSHGRCLLHVLARRETRRRLQRSAVYLFGIEPACVTRYFISITSTRQEFIKREFPSMSDEEIC